LDLLVLFMLNKATHFLSDRARTYHNARYVWWHHRQKTCIWRNSSEPFPENNQNSFARWVEVSHTKSKPFLQFCIWRGSETKKCTGKKPVNFVILFFIVASPASKKGPTARGFDLASLLVVL